MKRWLIIFSAMLSAMIVAGLGGYIHHRKVVKWENEAHERCRELSKADRDLLSGTDLAFVMSDSQILLAEYHLKEIPFLADPSALIGSIDSSKEAVAFMKDRLVEEAAARKEREQAREIARLREEALAWEESARDYLSELRSDHPPYRMGAWKGIAREHLRRRPPTADEALFKELENAVQ